MILVALAAALPSVFGLQLGAPLDLPPCRYQDGRAELGYDVHQPVTCATAAKSEPQFNRPWPSTTIWFPPKSAPLIVKNWNLRAIVLDGRLAGVEFYTAGAEDQQAVLADLEAKFGKPSSLVTTGAQNALGASVQVVHARWRGNGYSVRFDGVTDRLDLGEVVIDTDPAAQVRAKADQADAAARPPL